MSIEVNGAILAEYTWSSYVYGVSGLLMSFLLFFGLIHLLLRIFAFFVEAVKE
ncbi:MAG: hypothetical protein NDF54_10440 [archaeon GB-1867-035]|nr:hypothetical protein [Candidatus Culexmicrobium profundum]